MNGLPLIPRIIARGDRLCIHNGKLQVVLASGEAFEYANYGQFLIDEIIELLGVPVFEYIGYSTGKYSGGKYAGVTLQFNNVLTGQSGFACFNAVVNYQRTTRSYKKGSPLPKKQFRLKSRSCFHTFWKKTGLPKPPRYYDRMGNLKGVLFTASYVAGEKFKNESIAPLNVTFEQIQLATHSRLSHDQAATKPQPNITTKEYQEAQTYQGLQQNITTGKYHYGNKANRVKGDKGNVLPISISPKDQTTDEWIHDYDKS